MMLDYAFILIIIIEFFKVLKLPTLNAFHVYQSSLFGRLQMAQEGGQCSFFIMSTLAHFSCSLWKLGSVMLVIILYTQSISSNYRRLGRATQISSLSDTEPIRYRTYQIPNVSNTERIRYRMYQIPNVSDTEPEPVRYPTHQIQNLISLPTPPNTQMGISGLRLVQISQSPLSLPAHNDRQLLPERTVAKLGMKQVHPSPLSPFQLTMTAMWQNWG